jgi:riboflavin synthase
MFTGIVEHVGTVSGVRAAGNARVLHTIAPALAPLLHPGESIAVNGVCLTVESVDTDGFDATAVLETLARTTLGELSAGAHVNLERAASAGTLFGGHLVQGHVDGIASVTAFAAAADGGRILEIEVPDDVHDLCIDKGSMAVDGVSLTIARKLRDRRVAIAIVPHTLRHTIVMEYRPGHRVNVEADVIARYVREQVRSHMSRAQA